MRALVIGALAVIAVPAIVVACDDESGEARCSELPLYNVRDAGLDPTLAKELAEQGCITLPVAPSASVTPSASVPLDASTD